VEVGQIDGAFRCEYRLVRAARFGPWQSTNPVPEVGGTFLYLQGVTDDDAVQISIESADRRRRWTSDVHSQWMEIRLRVVP
jgi:hypothetical protein